MANAKTNVSDGSTTIDPQEMSKKELDNKRKEITKYYSENIPSLKTQLEYEELLRDIEKTRAERLQAQMYIAQTMAPEPEKEDDTPIANMPSDMRVDTNAISGAEAAQQIKRTLKKS
tara:strand:+ start:1957 stop:2307 length:351 start_codon:yes stop_codon:yes gene_type:complete